MYFILQQLFLQIYFILKIRKPTLLSIEDIFLATASAFNRMVVVFFPIFVILELLILMCFYVIDQHEKHDMFSVFFAKRNLESRILSVLSLFNTPRDKIPCNQMSSKFVLLDYIYSVIDV